MLTINKVELVFRFMPDFIELYINDEPVFRAQGNNDTLRIARRMEQYFLRKGDEQHGIR